MFRRRRKRDAQKTEVGPRSTIKRTMSIESMDSTMSDASFNVTNKPTDLRDFKLANIFWRAKLSCHRFHVGNPLVTFSDLWPEEVKDLISCFKDPELQDSVVTCCKLVLRCGPIRVLRELLDQRIINIDQRLEEGLGLLHYAVLACNDEAVSFLCSRGASVKQQDKLGRTVDQVCYCSRTRRCLPTRYHGSSFRKKQGSFHDKKVIFEYVQQPDRFNDLQIQIQSMDFDINHDKDQKGNLLLHAAVKGGLPQLSLILNLVQFHGANVEATNRKGMTPLILASQLGLDVIVEILICVIGADPDTKNNVNGWTALHYAAQKNHVHVIDCLVKRGADINIEDKFSMRADDIAGRCDNNECRDLIRNLRHQRCILLSQYVRKGNLSPNDARVKFSDHFNVDNDGLTLIMAAAKANRCDNLSILLKEKNCPVNAQHHMTGKTALTMAAMDGNANVLQTLLTHNALATIPDIEGRLALHYACIHGHIDCVQVIVESTQGLHGLYTAFQLAKDTSIKALLHEAMERRQREITNPTLFECVMNGDASKIYCMLEEGDDVNPITGTSDWPVYMAVGNGHFEVVKLLQQYGGDIWSLHSATRSSVLHVACSRGLQEIVCHLLYYCHPNDSHHTIDINAINKVGVSALQLAASKGHSAIVKMLLEHGASAAIIDDQGRLYKCVEYEGVQALIEKHRKNRTERIMLGIKDKKRFKQLKKMWQPKFDHNLRNKAGDTPLMTACLYGRLEAVKFFLETAVQNMEEEEGDLERSTRWRRESDNDSGTFLESCSPGTSRRNRASLDYMECSTDFSDYEDISAYHPSRYDLYPSIPTQDISSESDSNLTPEGLKRAVQHSRRMIQGRPGTRKCLSDTETLDTLSQLPECLSRPRDNVSIASFNATGSVYGGSKAIHSRTPSMSEIYVNLGQPTRPNIYQGSTVNHICASNTLDGCTAVHRAIQCSDQKIGLAILALLVDKDTTIINVQNCDGITALHLACKLDRRQMVKKLVSVDYIDLNIRTLDGKLPEEMARSERSKVAKMVKNARANIEGDRWLMVPNEPTTPASSYGQASSIDFDKLDERFDQMKKRRP
ncbi:serine/threonine-protein phosphatase 6 regulatory ankyrin repeat subunit B isoform X3 [Strongylocentrotus purpuratus]|uniref:Uncharacterized protein n=1 Tax=Strongylocentrotus purpuratus TaxID=7668 RepID=A0A7M7N3B7_STRPU|nr:serine/threonine-protein phosphatase 6 regulatory ankyrin repeat subunit B isoform X3 [Strongylocentrotus purpuratus]